MELLIKDNKNITHTMDIETIDFNKLRKQLNYIFPDFIVTSSSKSLDLTYIETNSRGIISAALLERNEILRCSIQFDINYIRDLNINIFLQDKSRILNTVSLYSLIRLTEKCITIDDWTIYAYKSLSLLEMFKVEV